MKALRNESQIGVMSVVHEGRKPFGMQTYFFEDMVKSVPDLQEAIFFFSPLNWDSNSNLVSGYKFMDGEWLESQENIPQIIYDRSFSSNNHQKIKIDNCRAYLRESERTIINPFKLADLLNDKTEFHSFLLKNDIPSLQTYPFDAIQEEDFFDKIGASRIYVKPTFGSKGKGIFVIEKRNETFTLFDNLGKAIYFENYKTLLGELVKEVSLENYFVQEEAKIEWFEDAPFDIRVLVQNYGNEYKVTGSAVRIGQRKSMTSNLNSGGRALPMEELATFFKNKYDKDVDALQIDIEKLCLDCTEVIRNHFGEFCEIGFDTLITKDNGPIIIEANSKPSRWVFVKIADYLDEVGKDSSYYRDRRNETVSVPMKYATYLWNEQKR